MRIIGFSLLFTALVFGGVAQASSADVCESAFNPVVAANRSPVESQFLQAFASSSQSLRLPVRSGYVGYTALTFAQDIELSNVIVEGLEAREALREGDRFGLDLFIREPDRMHDIWKVPLANEAAALAYLVSVRIGLPVALKEDPSLRGFQVRSGDSSSRFGDPVQTENLVGENLDIVGIETLRSTRKEDAVVVFKLRDRKTGELIAITSRTTANAMRALKSVLQTGKVKMIAPGAYFSVPGDNPPMK